MVELQQLHMAGTARWQTQIQNQTNTPSGKIGQMVDRDKTSRIYRGSNRPSDTIGHGAEIRWAPHKVCHSASVWWNRAFRKAPLPQSIQPITWEDRCHAVQTNVETLLKILTSCLCQHPTGDGTNPQWPFSIYNGWLNTHTNKAATSMRHTGTEVKCRRGWHDNGCQLGHGVAGTRTCVRAHIGKGRLQSLLVPD